MKIIVILEIFITRDRFPSIDLNDANKKETFETLLWKKGYENKKHFVDLNCHHNQFSFNRVINYLLNYLIL